MISVLEYISCSYLILLVFAPILFLLDGRKADAVMFTLTTASVLLYLYASLNYLSIGMPTLHIALSGLVIRNGILDIIVDPMSVCVGFVVVTAGYAFLLYSIEYISHRNLEYPVNRGKGRFYGWMMLFMGSTLAFLFSSTLILMLMFFELMSLSCWGLVSYYLTPKAHKAALKALITTHIGSLLGFFTAISYCVARGVQPSLYSLKTLDPNSRLILFAAILIASLAKSAQFPFYSWLPDAMVAPTPASAFLHGAAMIEMGVYLTARMIQFMQPLPPEATALLTIFVSITLFLTAYLFIAQKDAKKLLAYSTIAETGIMYAGLITATLGIPLGLQASIYLLFTHAYVKGLAFLTAGLFSYYLGTVNMAKIRGLLEKSKFIAFSWILALVGLAGVPPMPIFFGKLWIIISLIDAMTKLSYIMISLLAVVVCSISFFIISLYWIHSIILEPEKLEDGTNIYISSILLIPMLILIALAFIAPFLAYIFLDHIHFAIF